MLHSDDALGILSYMGSLLNTLHSGELINKDTCQHEASYIDALRSSFQTQESRSKNIRAIEESTRSTYRIYIGWTLALVSLFFGIVARPYYQQVPESHKFQIPLTFSDLTLLSLLILFIACLLYLRLSAHFISAKLDETSIRHFVSSRHGHGKWQLVKSFTIDNRWGIFAFLLLVAGALVAL